jgi:hypothetical protein
MDHPGAQPDPNAAADPDAALAVYLAAHDAMCPRCSYNLRGVEAARCPECGTGLRLTLERRRRLGGWGPFLLLVFGWLLIAGGMNTARNLRTLDQTRIARAQAAAAVQQTRLALQAQIQAMQSRTSILHSPLDEDAERRFPGLKQMREQQDQMVQAMNNRLAAQLRASMNATPAPAPAPQTLLETWRAGGWVMQAGSIWSLGLALFALAGLVMTVIAAARGWKGTRLVIWACALFALYAGWHITLFLREF